MLGTGIALAGIAVASKIKEDSFLGMMYKDIAQPSIQKLGRALEITTEFCTTPVLLLKYGSIAANLSYKKHIDNYAKKLEAIPEEEIIPVYP